ncbi:hypothetical protein L6164_036191 [Bauhinia variegata]|uniref:Uncharacterized protein n=1 Tax=Bauhinia variegata TaxID=167791 RepID=A0ACB9KG75_BAUVA|nr:hypothetical protein L6164_036191 [Bauhinia variegata]
MGKGIFSFRRPGIRRRRKKTVEPPQSPSAQQPLALSSPNNNANNSLIAGGAVGKAKKKAAGARLWMRFDRSGRSELVEWDKNSIISRAAIPARDLRILGPVFSHSSNILAREKAMVVNLEFIKVIVTAEEVLLLDPLRQEVLPFVEQLRQQLPCKNQPNFHGADDEPENEMQVSIGRQWLPPDSSEGVQSELPFEFQVLEIALEVVCTYLDSKVADLERVAYPVLDELARNVSTKNLEHVRSLKSNLTRLLARVQKVRDEIEHLLDDNEDMAELYLTRKWLQIQQSVALSGAVTSNSMPNTAAIVSRLSSIRSGSIVTSNFGDDNDVEDLEMLLEAYFMQLDGTRNKILSVREYIDDTEDYVNIQLDNQRNELIQLQLTLTIASFAIAVETLIAGIFGKLPHNTIQQCEFCFPLIYGPSGPQSYGFEDAKRDTTDLESSICKGIGSAYMANSKNTSGIRNWMYSGKHAPLPPKSPFPSVSQAYADYVPNHSISSKVVAQRPRDGSTHHQRTASESLIIEEQPSWLDDLLNEPETPVRKGGHRRSSSDSFAYLDTANFSNMSYADQDEYRYKNVISIPSWTLQDFDHGKDARHIPMYRDSNSTKHKNRTWESSLSAVTHSGGVPSGRDNVAFPSSRASSTPHEADGGLPTMNEKQDSVESGTQDAKASSERKDGSHAKSSASETDSKRAKQQFAQRSRVRKLQYIAELERNVQALQAEGSEVSAELDFLNQQNLILSMENKALKQRLESLAQEQLIKYLEQEVLEREIGRLRALFQQQQPQQHPQQQQPSGSHRRTSSRDLESQFANLSLKHKDTNSGRDPVTGPLRI